MRPIKNKATSNMNFIACYIALGKTMRRVGVEIRILYEPVFEIIDKDHKGFVYRISNQQQRKEVIDMPAKKKSAVKAKTKAPAKKTVAKKKKR